MCRLVCASRVVCAQVDRIEAKAFDVEWPEPQLGELDAPITKYTVRLMALRRTRCFFTRSCVAYRQVTVRRPPPNGGVIRALTVKAPLRVCEVRVVSARM